MNGTEGKGKTKRISLEIIRIVAVSAMIYIHSGVYGFEVFRTAETEAFWLLVMFLDMLAKASVPLFFAVSGALLLKKDESIKDLFLKRILRYGIIIVFFSFVYYVRLVIMNPEYGFSIKYFIKCIYEEPFVTPFWFLYYYMVLLLTLPILRAVAKSMTVGGYVLLACIALVMSWIIVPETLFGFSKLYLYFSVLTINFLYPIMGHWIANVLPEQKEKWFSGRARAMMGIALILNYSFLIWMNNIEMRSVPMAELSGDYFDQFQFVSTVAVLYFVIYLWDVKKINISERTARVIQYIGSCGLAIYLFENMFRDTFARFYDLANSQMGKYAMTIPYIAGIAGVGILISTIWRRIPLINKLGV